METIKILVECHKPGSESQDGVYTPIHIGRAISKYQDEMSYMIGDDTGDNISEKNPKYCELTAQYWAWKNLHNVEYVGFCHYRRFFSMEMSEEKISKLLCHYDVIALKFHYHLPMYWEIVRHISIEHFTILLMVIKKKYPDYEQTMLDYLRDNILYPKNMFICRKDFFDQYAAWLFDILFECEKHMKTMPYSRADRSLAYMGEYLMPVYMMHHHCKMKFVDHGDSPNTLRRKTIKDVCRNIIKDIVHGVICLSIKKPKILEYYYLEAVLTGFKQDKISI